MDEDIDIYKNGGNENSCHTHCFLIIAILVALILMFCMKEQFVSLKNNLPFNSGASMRFASDFSSLSQDHATY